MTTLRLLLVDPNPQRAEQLTSELSNEDHQVLPAENLADASEALGLQRFDAIVLRLAPSFDGIAAFANALRALEKSQKMPSRTPIFVCPPTADLPDYPDTAHSWPGIDSFLPDHFDAHVLLEAVNRLSSLPKPESAFPSPASTLPVFEPEQFRAQMGNDPDLVIEIIDLFFSESARQMYELQQALDQHLYDEISRLAHTIKGSLGSLQAPSARLCSHELEAAARVKDFDRVTRELANLDRALRLLTPALSQMRDAELALRP